MSPSGRSTQRQGYDFNTFAEDLVTPSQALDLSRAEARPDSAGNVLATNNLGEPGCPSRWLPGRLSNTWLDRLASCGEPHSALVERLTRP